VLGIAVSPVRLEEAAASIREHHGMIAAIERHTLNQPVLLEVSKIAAFVERRITWVAQVAL
jgi:hypothetical protein